jgi:hypothetical protein
MRSWEYKNNVELLNVTWLPFDMTTKNRLTLKKGLCLRVTCTN